MKLKKLISAALSLMLVFPAGAFAAGPAYGDNISQIIGDGNIVTFIDVPQNFWAKDAINSFAEQGIIDGYSDGTFRPNESVSREEFCKLLISTFSQPLSAPSEASFADVAPGRWSYPYIETCKEFLTGYSNPFGGKPSYHPAEAAQREDIAVALVRMMGLTDSSSSGDYAVRRFDDWNSISPQLRSYVSIAIERGLMNGYTDGTFRPNKGITRAETVVLLGRATKQAVTNIEAGLNLSASALNGKDGKTVTVHITAEEGTIVTVDGQKVQMSPSLFGEYEGNYVYKFENEGSKTFTVTGTRAGKAKTIQVTAQYRADAPVLKITSCPTSVTKKDVTISGTIYNKGGGATLNINGEPVASTPGYEQTWSQQFTLQEGANTFEFVLTNDAGKSVTDTRTITLGLDAPVLKIISCPTNATQKEVTISGTISDKNGHAALTMNGMPLTSTPGYERSWSKKVTLREGENKFIFELTNDAGKKTVDTRIISLTVYDPVLKIDYCPKETKEKQIFITGTISDPNCPVSLSINGVPAAYTKGYEVAWRKLVTLKAGDNVFEFVLTNEAGKVIKETRTVFFDADKPVLRITDCPETSLINSTVTIQGTIASPNRGSTLTMNGEVIASTNGHETAWSKVVTLKGGENYFQFVLTDDLGSQVKETRKIERPIASRPVLNITSFPTNSTTGDIEISGTISDPSYNASLKINGELVVTCIPGITKEWYKTYHLEEGYHTFTFEVTNDMGKTTEEKRYVNVFPDSPEIVFRICPETSDQQSLYIMGNVKGIGSNGKLFMNGEYVHSNSDGGFAEKVTLREGVNTFEFRAVSGYGKEITVTKTITYTAPSQEGEEEQQPETDL